MAEAITKTIMGVEPPADPVPASRRPAEPHGAGNVERSETSRGSSHEARFAGGERGRAEPQLRTKKEVLAETAKPLAVAGKPGRKPTLQAVDEGWDAVETEPSPPVEEAPKKSEPEVSSPIAPAETVAEKSPEPPPARAPSPPAPAVVEKAPPAEAEPTQKVPVEEPAPKEASEPLIPVDLMSKPSLPIAVILPVESVPPEEVAPRPPQEIAPPPPPPPPAVSPTLVAERDAFDKAIASATASGPISTPPWANKTDKGRVVLLSCAGAALLGLGVLIGRATVTVPEPVASASAAAAPPVVVPPEPAISIAAPSEPTAAPSASASAPLKKSKKKAGPAKKKTSKTAAPEEAPSDAPPPAPTEAPPPKSDIPPGP